MEKDLDMAVVVLVRGHRAPACPGSVEDEGMVYCYYGVLKHYQEFWHIQLLEKTCLYERGFWSYT